MATTGGRNTLCFFFQLVFIIPNARTRQNNKSVCRGERRVNSCLPITTRAIYSIHSIRKIYMIASKVDTVGLVPLVVIAAKSRTRVVWTRAAIAVDNMKTRIEHDVSKNNWRFEENIPEMYVDRNRQKTRLFLWDTFTKAVCDTSDRDMGFFRWQELRNNWDLSASFDCYICSFVSLWPDDNFWWSPMDH